MKVDKITNLISLLIYSLSIVQVAKKTILSNTLEYSPWSYSELLISYPGIFTRRGLIGELITLFDSDAVLLNTVNIFVFVNFVVFALLSYIHIKISKLCGKLNNEYQNIAIAKRIIQKITILLKINKIYLKNLNKKYN